MTRDYFRLESHPRRGLLPLEWVMLGYMALTLVVCLFCYTKVANPDAMLWGRLRVLAVTLAMWGVYRALPCRMMLLARVLVQMLLLAWWYPDTYEINRMFPNMDHVVAQWEQSLFGCQPALYFASRFPSPVVSELMDMGYFCYYPMIAVVAFYYFFARYGEFLRASLIILTSFFVYYVVFIFFPVVGPTYYYNAVGVGEIAKGVFPILGDYFNTHTSCLPSPGYADGLFYQLVEDAKQAGERPTAAFPSSHVGVSTICMLLALRTRRRALWAPMLFVYAFLCMATVYIQAHYLVDALAGFVSALAIYAVLYPITRKHE